MACVFGEMRTLKTGWRWGQKTCPVLGKNKKTMQSHRTCGATRIWHLGFISRCTAYSVRWVAFRCCVSVRWIACSFAAVELCRGTLTAHTWKVTPDSSPLVAHNSPLVAHGPQLTAHNSQLTAHGPRLTTYSSELTAHSPRLTIHDPRLTALCSQFTPDSSHLTAHFS